MKTEVRELENAKKEYRQNQNLAVEQLNELREYIANKEILLKQGSSKIWDELTLPDYDPFFDYIQSVTYFAYVTCFSVVLPLTPLLVLINQLVNMRLHAYKVCRVRRRPLAQKTGGVSVLSVSRVIDILLELYLINADNVQNYLFAIVCRLGTCSTCRNYDWHSYKYITHGLDKLFV